jgi:preprotein translocase subunit SecD
MAAAADSRIGMPARRIIIMLLLVAVVAIGGASGVYLFLANANSNRGLHVLVSIDPAEVLKDALERLRGEARRRLREARVGIAAIGVVDGAVQLTVAKPDEVEVALATLRAIGSDVEVGSGEGGNVTVTLPKVGQDKQLAEAVRKSIGIVRQRCDAANISIRRVEAEGRDRIRVHAANPEDAARLRDLIVNSGKLSFHEVHPVMTAQAAESAGAPEGFRVYATAMTPPASMLLREAPVMQGHDLADAQAGFDPRTSEPVITFRLNVAGARKFGQFTAANVGRPFAVVVDGTVLSAPVIREPILGGAGQISGNFTAAEAQQLAVKLRSGTLPAKLTIIEERVVTRDE